MVKHICFWRGDYCIVDENYLTLGALYDSLTSRYAKVSAQYFQMLELTQAS